MTKYTFAQIPELVAKYEKRIDAVFKSSSQDVAEEVVRPVAKGGHMRIKTGFLRASFMASTSQMPQINPYARPPIDAADNSFDFDDAAIALVIATANVGRDTIYMGFTAGYAVYREYQDAMVRSAAQRWQRIVSLNAQKAIRAFP